MNMNKIMERQKMVVEMRKAGKSYREIGRAIGTGGQRAREIWHGEQVKAKRRDEYTGLSARAANILKNAGLKTKDDVLESLQNDSMFLRKQRNCGKLAYAEIVRWVGYDLDEKQVELEKVLQAFIKWRRGSFVMLAAVEEKNAIEELLQRLICRNDKDGWLKRALSEI